MDEVEKVKNKEACWTICPKCQGRGRKNFKLRKKSRLRFQIAMKEFEKAKSEGKPSVRPKVTQYLCDNCSGSGLVPASSHPIPDSENYPHVAIIGAGIGGMALAVACLHRGIPFTLYERDSSFDARTQGYGLTLQQASNAIKGLGLFYLKDGSNSTRHVVHTTEGKELTEWGMRTHSNVNQSPKRKNLHIPRQALRLALLEQLGGHDAVQWGYRLMDFKQCEVDPLSRKRERFLLQGSPNEAAPQAFNRRPDGYFSLNDSWLSSLVGKYMEEKEINSSAIHPSPQGLGFLASMDKSVNLSFQVNKEMKNVKADLVVGADGIRSVVRSLLIGEDMTPLRYLDYMVILGICSLKALQGVESSLLDSATVFQTVNGNERIYMMPYSSDSIMWQFSFPMPEEEAKALSARGAQALKDEACLRAQWHKPIPQILSATLPAQISGYPIYDRELLKPELLKKAGAVTLIGDAAHPMSPFKGQGANQALLDALALARSISIACTTFSNWRELGVRETVLTEFEEEMLARSASKVKDSAEAVEFLHSKDVLHEGHRTKGRPLRGNNL